MSRARALTSTFLTQTSSSLCKCPVQSLKLAKKWDELEGLRAKAEQRAEQLAKLDAEVARLQAELDELPNEPARATQGTQGIQSDEIRELRAQLSALNEEVGCP